MKILLPSLMAAVLAVSLPAEAGTLVDLAAEASLPANNDMVRAVVYAESSGSNAGEAAQKVNRDIAEALRLARTHNDVSARSGNQHSWPVYGAGQKLEGWRMRSELLLESTELASMSVLLGRLQQMRLAIGEVSLQPRPETRRQVEEAATREAIKAFQTRADVVASQLGRPWRLKQLSISQGGGMPMPMMRGAMESMKAGAAAMPLEGGETRISVNVSGQVELAD